MSYLRSFLPSQTANPAMELDLEPQAGVDSGAAVDLERELKLAWETERKGLAEAHGAAMDVGTLALLKELLRTALRTEREVRVDKVEVSRNTSRQGMVLIVLLAGTYSPLRHRSPSRRAYPPHYGERRQLVQPPLPRLCRPSILPSSSPEYILDDKRLVEGSRVCRARQGASALRQRCPPLGR